MVYGKRIVRSVLEKKVELSLCLIANVPVGKPGELHGIRLCRQNRGFWREDLPPKTLGAVRISGSWAISSTASPGRDTDEWALAHGYVLSVVPVQVDLTDYRRRSPCQCAGIIFVKPGRLC